MVSTSSSLSESSVKLPCCEFDPHSTKYIYTFFEIWYQMGFLIYCNTISTIKFSTGNTFSEALILESVNLQYDKRLFIELHEKYKFTTCCVQKLFICFCFDIQSNICKLVFFGEFNEQALVKLLVNCCSWKIFTL